MEGAKRFTSEADSSAIYWKVLKDLMCGLDFALEMCQTKHTCKD